MANTMISSIKNIKMLGMQGDVSDHISELRQKELDAAGSVRELNVIYTASGG